MQNGAVRTQVLLVVPGHVPGLSWSHTAAFTANAGHAHLWKCNIVAREALRLEEGSECEPTLVIVMTSLMPFRSFAMILKCALTHGMLQFMGFGYVGPRQPGW